ncbi:DUF1835 domain-containing protein [Paenibacillaceae bacterium WGS1546]|uniref:DUF1835 domain-containing protein n=1 Tax=Cohnella sp. WGS1546 TaxID=3366810 RepID=UPI00372D510B
MNERSETQYDKFLVPDRRTSIGEPNALAAKVHIAFGDSFAGSLKVALNRLGCSDTNEMIAFRDRFSIGPLWQLHEEAGQTCRTGWFRDRINHKDDEDDRVAQYQTIAEQMTRIPAEASIVIWSGHNAHEQAGLRYAIYLLRSRPNNVFVFNVTAACERRFNTPDQQIEYSHSGEIPPDKLQAIIGESEDNGPVPSETKRLLEQEWLSLASRHEALRIWDGERIVNVDESYFDSYLLETVKNLHAVRGNRDFIKAARVIGQAIGYCEQYIGDDYFDYRLRELVCNGALEIKGVPRAISDYSVRLKRRGGPSIGPRGPYFVETPSF